jgi:hypothetical protein
MRQVILGSRLLYHYSMQEMVNPDKRDKYHHEIFLKKTEDKRRLRGRFLRY